MLLGTTISAVSVMLVMAVSLSGAQTSVPTAATLGLVGHFEIMVTNPDGTVSYAQGDNTVTGPGKDDIGNDGFTLLTRVGPWICTALGTGTNVAAADDIAGELTNTNLACDASPSCDDEGTFAATVANVCTIVTTATLDNGGGTDECDPTCLLTEVKLVNAGETSTFAQTALATDITANIGAAVEVTYKVAVGGTIP